MDDLLASKTALTNFLLQLTPKLSATLSAIDVLVSFLSSALSNTSNIFSFFFFNISFPKILLLFFAILSYLPGEQPVDEGRNLRQT